MNNSPANPCEKAETPRIVITSTADRAEDIVIALSPREYRKLTSFAERRGVDVRDVVRASVSPKFNRRGVLSRRAHFSLHERQLDQIVQLAKHDNTGVGVELSWAVSHYLATRGLFPPAKHSASLERIRLDPVATAAPNAGEHETPSSPPVRNQTIVKSCAPKGETRPLPRDPFLTRLFRRLMLRLYRRLGC